MTVKAPAKPKTHLTTAELKHIEIEKEIFLKAQELIGVPWQAMAAIWFRESFSIAPPKTPGGQFQFDPPNPPASALKSSLKHYAKNITEAEMDEIVEGGVNNFSTACILAACHLRDIS